MDSLFSTNPFPSDFGDRLLSKQIIAAPTKQVNFDLSSVVIDWDHVQKLQRLFLLTDYFGDNTGALDFISIYINGDLNPANYQFNSFYADSTAPHQLGGAGSNCGAIFPNSIGSIEMEIEIINNKFEYETRSDTTDSATNTLYLYDLLGIKIAPVTALTSIRLQIGAAGPNFSPGSLFALILSSEL